MTSSTINSGEQQNNLGANWQSWLSNIRVSWKLTLIISVLILGTLGVFLSAFIGLQALNHQLSNMYDITLVPVTALDRADITLGDIELQLGTLRNSNLKDSEISALFNTISDSGSTFTGILSRYQESSSNADFTKTLAAQDAVKLQEQERSAISSTKLYYDSYSTQLSKLRASFDAGKLNPHVLDSSIAALSATRNYLRQLTDVNRQFAVVSNRAASNAYRQSLYTMGITLALSTILGLILAFIVARSIVVRLVKVTEAAQYLKDEHSGQRAVIGMKGSDEIAQMANAFDVTADQLTHNLANLELRVADRTSELERRSLELSERTVQLELFNVRTQKRAAQFQAIAAVARTTAAVRKLNELLPRITTVVSEQFGFYHVGIFLLDEADQYAVLSATNSAGGKRMLARGHRLKVGAQGIIGYVTQTGKSRIALDTGTDATFFDNRDLPDTRSEMAFPLKSAGKVMGAMDVQSTQSNAFSQEDIDVLEVLADQISIAIENARQFDQTQRSLSEAETIYRQYVRHEWERISSTEDVLGYRHSIIGTQPLEKPVSTSEIQQVLESGEIITESNPRQKQASLSVPIKLRDEVIGFLNISSPQKRAWNKDEISLVKSVADRVAISAENARLFEETTDRAERERTVSQITSKIRSTNDPNQMIQIALDELRQALHVKDARIVPYTPPQQSQENG